MLLILLLFYNLHIKRNTFTSAANIHNLKDVYEKQFTTVLKKIMFLQGNKNTTTFIKWGV